MVLRIFFFYEINIKVIVWLVYSGNKSNVIGREGKSFYLIELFLFNLCGKLYLFWII